MDLITYDPQIMIPLAGFRGWLSQNPVGFEVQVLSQPGAGIRQITAAEARRQQLLWIGFRAWGLGASS